LVSPIFSKADQDKADKVRADPGRVRADLRPDVVAAAAASAANVAKNAFAARGSSPRAMTSAIPTGRGRRATSSAPPATVPVSNSARKIATSGSNRFRTACPNASMSSNT